MTKMTKTSRVTLHLTADDWDLYDKPGRETAANEMNEAFGRAFNEGLPRAEVEDAVMAVMRKYDDLGAFDSEPVRMLEHLIDKAFRSWT
jgi:hypothetical protein